MFKASMERFVVAGVFEFLQKNGIHLYTVNCDPETGIKHSSLMDVTSVDQIMRIAERNETDDWIEEDLNE